MKKIATIIMCFILTGNFAFAQKKTLLDGLSVSFESNMKWYNDDDKLGDFKEENRFRSNSYLKLNYRFLKNFSANIQIESYEPMRILNYYSEYKKTNISTYSLRFKTEKVDLTAGYFYEQFGSGLLLRSFEERQLGLNNALRGGRVKYTPTNYLNFTALGGQHKIAFDVAKSFVWGFDGSFNLSQAFNLKSLNDFSIGVSYVGKKENLETEEFEVIPVGFPDVIHSFAFKTDLDFDGFYTNLEYSIKGKDASFASMLEANRMIKDKYFTGSALLYTLGYSQKGFGVSGTFRRLENMSFFAERDFAKPGKNQFNMLSINYIPALTKQQDYSLANIYIYQAQPSLIITRFGPQAGEIGGQFDLFYNIKKGSRLGGKYGAKLALNFSYWSMLDATFDIKNSTYSANFFKFGKALNKDFNFEIRKKWSKKVTSIFTYIHKEIDKGVALGGPLAAQGMIKADIAVAEATYKLPKRKSIRFELQHLWTKKDKKNWIGVTTELALNRRFSIYATDSYNYGNSDKEKRIHYYNIGGSYTKGRTRIALNYGRQRGGLLCVGGVCRYEQPSKGFTVNLSTVF